MAAPGPMAGSAFATTLHAIANINSCVSSSSCSASDKQGIYQAIAQLCANAGSTVTAAPEASYSATSGGNAYPTSLWSSGANSANWGSWVSAVSTNLPGPPAGWSGGQWGPRGSGVMSGSMSTITGAPTGGHNGMGMGGPNGNGNNANMTGRPQFGGPGGYGPFGAGDHDGYGPFGSSGSWTAGPWTSWWGSSGCPASTWSGWTSGSWASNADWTTWRGCAASTTATSTYTTTSSGSTVTGITYGVQVAQVTGASSTGASSTGASASKATAVSGAGTERVAKIGGVLAAAVLVGAVAM
ncbi:hypothetical protein B0A49_11873 [Cryomyces minteri]|uniref:Extracellular membrane protein CFEM domain-containing protein n=1 Tax=Cryomyces minteri TaxID=331657 RepID=A0A4U0WTC4_9PEZI|nr:hypothetical protein B0A49_11873 [Cryomyces minteri]